MNDKAKILLDEARKLPAEDQIRLAEEILAPYQSDFGSDVEALWEAEIRRRWDDFSAGKEPSYDADKVLERLRKRRR